MFSHFVLVLPFLLRFLSLIKKKKFIASLHVNGVIIKKT